MLRTAGLARRFFFETSNKKGRIAAAFREIDISKIRSQKEYCSIIFVRSKVLVDIVKDSLDIGSPPVSCWPEGKYLTNQSKNQDIHNPGSGHGRRHRCIGRKSKNPHCVKTFDRPMPPVSTDGSRKAGCRFPKRVIFGVFTACQQRYGKLSGIVATDREFRLASKWGLCPAEGCGNMQGARNLCLSVIIRMP
jgi:hypothetical protein